MDNIKNRFCISDLIVIVIVAVFGILTLIMPFLYGDGEYAVIKYDGGTYKYSLKEERTVELTSCGIKMTVIIEDGTVRVEESSCPDGICVGTGRIGRPGSSIVCVPGEVSVYIVSDGGESYDIAAG